jgi:hypothetical protein
MQVEIDKNFNELPAKEVFSETVKSMVTGRRQQGYQQLWSTIVKKSEKEAAKSKAAKEKRKEAAKTKAAKEVVGDKEDKEGKEATDEETGDDETAKTKAAGEVVGDKEEKEGKEATDEETSDEDTSDEDDTDDPEANIECARIVIAECMQRETTEEDMLATMYDLDDTVSQQRYEAWWRQSGKYLEVEANLLIYHQVVGLRFLPTKRAKLVGRSKRRRSELHGHYMVHLKPDEGPDQYIRVAPDWVADNYTPTTLTLLQRMGVDMNQEYLGGPKGKEKKESGFISLEYENSILELYEGYQIAAIRYHPKLKQWRGMYRIEKGRNQFVALTHTWMTANIDKDFMKMLKSAGQKGGRRYIDLPYGDSAEHSSVQYQPDAPIVRFRQYLREKSCVLKASSSAAHYLGDPAMGSDLFVENQALNGRDAWAHVRDTVIKAGGRYQISKCGKFFKPTLESKEYWLCVLAVKGMDCKEDHVLAIADGWIFDSNFDKALPLNEASLGLCCSEDGRETAFARVTRGWLVKRRNKKNTRSKTRRSKQRKRGGKTGGGLPQE